MMHCGAPELRNIDHHAFSFDHLVGAGEQIDASFKNGILNVTLPKSPTAQQKVRRIAINGK